MNKLSFRSLMAGAAMAAGLAMAAPAAADGPLASDFRIDENIIDIEGTLFGQYTVYNNSEDWHIYAFAVTNSSGGNPQTGRNLWEAGTFCSSDFCGDGFNNLGFVELTGFGFGYWDAAFTPNSFLGNPISPDQFSSQFTFIANLESDWQINVFRGNGNETGTVFGSVGGIPEPATWGLMITGFGFAGAALRRRKLSQPIKA